MMIEAAPVVVAKSAATCGSSASATRIDAELANIATVRISSMPPGEALAAEVAGAAAGIVAVSVVMLSPVGASRAILASMGCGAMRGLDDAARRASRISRRRRLRRTLSRAWGHARGSAPGSLLA
jgi:hypothetical protein